MDDFEAYSDDLSALEDVADIISEQLGRQGLPLNVAKTFISEAPHDLLEVFSVDDEKASDAHLGGELFPTDADPARFELGLLLREVSAESMKPLRAWLAKILANHMVDRIGYAADHLARLVRRSGKWHDYIEWFQQSLRRHPLRTDWVPHAWSQMFPQKALPVEMGQVSDAYGERIQTGRMPFTLLPSALTQLCRWRQGDLIDYCRQAASQAVHPFEMRAIGLAAAGEEGRATSEVRAWLGTTFETNIARLALEKYGVPRPVLRWDPGVAHVTPNGY